MYSFKEHVDGTCKCLLMASRCFIPQAVFCLKRSNTSTLQGEFLRFPFFFSPQNFSSLSIYNILTTKMNVWFQHCKNTFYLLILALTEYKYIWKGLHGQKASGSVSGKRGKPLFFHAVLVFGSKPAHSTTFSRYAPLHQLNHSALFLMLTTFFLIFFFFQTKCLICPCNSWQCIMVYLEPSRSFSRFRYHTIQ